MCKEDPIDPVEKIKPDVPEPGTTATNNGSVITEDVNRITDGED